MEVFAVTEATPKIYLGKQGENNTVPILFKVNTWINIYGEGGTFTLSHKRATDSVPYPAAITLTDEGVLWLITAADNAVAGFGECELRYSVGDVVKKSVTWKTKTSEALAPEGDTPPDPFESWYENIIAAGDRAEGFSNAAKAYSEAAQTAAENAAEAKRLSEEYAAAALEHRNAAEGFKNTAENAKTEAEKAENEAKAAAESAKADKSAAAASAQAAEAAKQAALASENAAKAAQAAANASATAAGGYASEAIDAANAAGGYASNASQYADAAGRFANAAAGYASRAQNSAEAASQSAQRADTSASNAAESERQAEASKEAIENMGALAQTTAPGSTATVTKTVAPDGTVTLEFGIPRGDKGDKGDDYELTYNDKVEIASIVPGMVVVNVSGITPVIVGEDNHRYICGEVTTIDITPPASGMCDVIFTSGSTAAVLTLTGATMPEWFDSTTLEADKTYELNFMDGYGTVALW